MVTILCTNVSVFNGLECVGFFLYLPFFPFYFFLSLVFFLPSLSLYRCPVDNSIFPSFMETGNALESSYEAFRFTESYGVIFQCNVKYCIGRCEPVRILSFLPSFSPYSSLIFLPVSLSFPSFPLKSQLFLSPMKTQLWIEAITIFLKQTNLSFMM